MPKRFKYKIKGIVQGVGFRPFVFRAAREHRISGYVLNRGDCVLIEAEGCESDLAFFEDELQNNAPKLSKINHFEKKSIAPKFAKKFKILNSIDAKKVTSISPDIGICESCKGEIDAKDGKRFEYLYNCCTECGARYSITKTIPYDRANTSMGLFEMCDDCMGEYGDVDDRRFHAQNISCKKCGIRFSLDIDEAGKLLKGGEIVAIKGIGGFHFVCDATNTQAIKKLRVLKKRSLKPFALMCRDLEMASELAKIDEVQKKLLDSSTKPIVLLEKKDATLEAVAPNIDKIGVMLPHTPFYYKLTKEIDSPIIVTSANLPKEPIIKDAEVLKSKFDTICYVDNNIEIISSVDDSVASFYGFGEYITLRGSRGVRPFYKTIKTELSECIIAFGSNQKASFSIFFEQNIVLSPYLGELDSVESIENYKAVLERFLSFYGLKPTLFIADLHDNYESSKIAKEMAKDAPLLKVQHHYAHILSTMAEYDMTQKVLGFAFDGSGLGDDGCVWGGEVFECDAKGYERVYHFKYFKLIGSTKAIKDARRVVLGLLFEHYSFDEVLEFEVANRYTREELKMLHNAWEKSINSPLTSSVGRLFDAVAIMGGFLDEVSYDGEAGLVLESFYDKGIKESYNYTIKNGEIEIDMVSILKDNNKHLIASKFLNTLADIVLSISKNSKLPVVLSGGVFQNTTLLNLVVDGLRKNSITYYISKEIALNDEGISFGQMWYGIYNPKSPFISF